MARGCHRLAWLVRCTSWDLELCVFVCADRANGLVCAEVVGGQYEQSGVAWCCRDSWCIRCSSRFCYGFNYGRQVGGVCCTGAVRLGPLQR